MSIHIMFTENLTKKVISGLGQWHKNNYDYHRYGKLTTIQSAKEMVRRFAWPIRIRGIQARFENLHNKLHRLSNLWSKLNDNESRELLEDLIAIRILTYRGLKLRTNSVEHWETLSELESRVATATDTIDTGFKDFRLARLSLNDFGSGIEAYIRPGAILAQFVHHQYSYHSPEGRIGVEENEVVLDCGGCWGETSLHFSEMAGPNGQVFCFEFVPGNLEIFEENLRLNPDLAKRVTLVRQPLGRQSGQKIYFDENGPATRVELKDFTGAKGSAEITSIDDFIRKENVPKIYFIKMDIEGAELDSLKGAEATIRRDRPKLAISLYHSINDFFEIPEYIESLNLGYRFYLHHATIFTEETVLFAIASD